MADDDKSELRSVGADPLASGENLEPKAAEPQGVMSRIRNYFLTGLIVAGPVAITAYLVWAFVTWVDDLVRPLLPLPYRPESYLPVSIPGTGLIISFVVLTLLGFLTANLVGRSLVELGEMILDRMPIVRPIYKGLKQIFETLFSKSGTSFRRVGLVEFPGPGMWTLVFISQPPSAEIAARLPSEDDYHSVFLPCTPNPTTGFYFFVRKSELIEIDINTEAAATLIMSAGMVQPGAKDQKNLSALAEAARAARSAALMRGAGGGK